jgi:protein-disulfide isomerase
MKEDNTLTNDVPAGDFLVPVTNRDHIQGPGTAPVTLVEYADFECPFSHRAFHVIKRVQRETGDQLLLVFRHFPQTSIHPQAQRAAEAAEAAAAQGQFWEMHDILFEHQRALADDDLRGYAAGLGLDLARFDQDMAQRRHAARIEEDLEDGIRSGVLGTPTLFVNSIRFEGSVDLESLLGTVWEAAAP